MNWLNDYVPTEEDVKILETIRALYLVGPAGSGKDTIQNELLKTGQFYKMITYTARPPRQNNGKLEENGKDYYFIDMNTAKKMADEQKFLEVAINHDYFYASSIDEFIVAKNHHKTPMADIDVKGISSFRRLSTNCIAVFLLPTSFEVIKERLIRRYGNNINETDFHNRLRTALFEMQILFSTDYYYVLVNRSIKETVEKTIQIVQGTYSEDRFSESTKRIAKKITEDMKNYLENI